MIAEKGREANTERCIYVCVCKDLGEIIPKPPFFLFLCAVVPPLFCSVLGGKIGSEIRFQWACYLARGLLLLHHTVEI